MNAIKPLTETADTVTLSRADYDALLSAREDVIDAAAFEAFDARIATEGKEAVLADYLPAEAVSRLLAGDSPMRVWRKHRGLSLVGLARGAGVSVSYLSEVERGIKTGSVSLLRAVGEALRVPMEDLVR